MSLLLDRPYKLVKFKGDWIIVPTSEFICIRCLIQFGEHNKMLFHDYLVQQSYKGWFHADIHLKCPKCGKYETYGVPISGSEYRLLHNSKWHREILDKEIVELYPDLKKELEKRLESWGYW